MRDMSWPFQGPFEAYGTRGQTRRPQKRLPWCITFEWRDGEALRVDLEQYH